MQKKIYIFFITCFVFWQEVCAQINLGFDQTPVGTYTSATAVNGWTISSQTATSCATSSVWTPGSPEFSIAIAPNPNAFAPLNINSIWAVLPPSPWSNYSTGGFNVANLNDLSASGLRTRIRQTFSVTAANTLFEYVIAVMLQDGNHLCCEQAQTKFNLYDCSGNFVPYWSKSYNAIGTSCTSGAPGFTVTSGWTWTHWQHEYIDLTAYLGSCVTVEVISGDCIYGTHAGATYFDSYAGAGLFGVAFSGQQLNTYSDPTNFCPGASVAQIQGPSGYAAYQWYAPNAQNQPVPIGTINGGNTPLVTINNPTAGVVYTVQLTAQNGYTFTQLDTLKYSSLALVGTGTYSSCPGGASGSASVLCSGSGTGYNYTWMNSGNTVVSTNSYAANLLPGVYSVSVSAIGSPGCGSFTTSMVVGLGAPNIYTVITAFCAGQTRTLTAPPGTLRRWYNGNVAISAALGGTASVLTVPSPTTGQFFWLAYTDPQGCPDSIKYLLNQTSPGSVTLSGVPYACANTNNGTMSLTLTAASGSPPGTNSFNVFSTSGPPYSSSVTNYAQNIFIANGLTAGNYSIIASDGACQYTNTFVINTFTNNFSANSNTVCVGNQAILGVSFTTAISAQQYNFLWSPAANIVGAALNATNISVMVNSNLTNTSGTNIFSVTVTPTLVNCPLTKTLSITSLTLPTPVITNSFQPFCTNAPSKTITVLPPGGTFSTSSGNWLNSITGVITPSLLPPGTQSFVYALIAGSCVNATSGSFSVSRFNSAALTTTAMTLCDNVTNCFNLLSYTQNSAGTWSGVGVANTQFCPLNVSPGLHTLTYLNYSTPNPTLCPDSQTMSVNILSSAIPGISTPAPFCNNAPPFVMTVGATGGAWSSPAPLFINQGGGVTPALSPGGIITVTYTGICGNTATVNLTTAIFHPATLTGSLSSFCVNSAPVNLMSIVASTVNGSWIGPGITNNIFTPTVAAGTYPVQYVTSSSSPPLCPDQSSLAIYVYDIPTITAPTNTTICLGETLTIPVSGASSYSLNGTFVFPVIVTPGTTTTYTITGASNNCSSQKVVTVQVTPCTSIEEITGIASLLIYPNPTDGNLFVVVKAPTKVILYNEMGQVLMEKLLDEGQHLIDLSNYSSGIYLLKCTEKNSSRVIKIIRTD